MNADEHRWEDECDKDCADLADEKRENVSLPNLRDLRNLCRLSFPAFHPCSSAFIRGLLIRYSSDP